MDMGSRTLSSSSFSLATCRKTASAICDRQMLPANVKKNSYWKNFPTNIQAFSPPHGCWKEVSFRRIATPTDDEVTTEIEADVNEAVRHAFAVKTRPVFALSNGKCLAHRHLVLPCRCCGSLPFCMPIHAYALHAMRLQRGKKSSRHALLISINGLVASFECWNVPEQPWRLHFSTFITRWRNLHSRGTATRDRRTSRFRCIARWKVRIARSWRCDAHSKNISVHAENSLFPAEHPSDSSSPGR